MQDKLIFREMLGELKKLADEHGNYLTTDEIKGFFKNGGLEEEHFQLIYEYLAGEKIEIEGYTPKKTAVLKEAAGEKSAKTEYEPEEDGNAPLEFYEEELKELEAIPEEEKWKLFQMAAAGDRLAKGRLTQGYLQTVYDLSRTYQYVGVPQGDLLQEGNIGLMLALEDLEVGLSLEEYEKGLFEKIQKAMEEAVEENQDLADMGQKIADRANHLQEAVKNLEEDLEHKVSVDELSAYLEMPEEEIKDILRMAGEEIKVDTTQDSEK